MDPEFPGDGAADATRIPEDLLRVGAILRFTPPGGDPWDIAISTPNWWRTPDPRLVAFISEWDGYLADVVDRRVVNRFDAIRVAEDELHDLVLFCGHSSITAVGVDGIVWDSGMLVADDLKVDAIHVHEIVCSGWDEAGRIEFSVDPATGRRI